MHTHTLNWDFWKWHLGSLVFFIKVQRVHSGSCIYESKSEKEKNMFMKTNMPFVSKYLKINKPNKAY